jgi:hypothetical protein
MRRRYVQVCVCALCGRNFNNIRNQPCRKYCDKCKKENRWIG